jgi:Na+-exporting ATPase
MAAAPTPLDIHDLLALPENGGRDGSDGSALRSAADEFLRAKEWHTLGVDEVLVQLGVADPLQGVPSHEVPLRRAAFGGNRLREGKPRSAVAIALSHFFSGLTLILAAVFVIAVVNEEWVDAVVVVIVIALNSSIGAWQEIKGEEAMAAIRHLASAHQAFVRRDGRLQETAVDDLVLGDIVAITNGQQLPADMRLLEVAQLEVDEAVLTGEAMPVSKVIEAIPRPSLRSGEPSTLPGSSQPSASSQAARIDLGDRVNMVFRQTLVSQGTGVGVVTGVGPATEIGRIADRLARRSAHAKTPLMRSMEVMMYALLLVGIIFGVFVFWAFQWKTGSDAFLYAAALLVAILPESVVVLITVSMAMGAKRMSRQSAIVRKLAALEQLGRVTDICSDKTGTLTVGSMRPARLLLFTPGNQSIEPISVSGAPMSRAATWTVPDKEYLPPLDLSKWLAEVPARQDSFEDALLVCALCSGVHLVPIPDKPLLLSGAGNPTEVALQELVFKACHAIPELEQGLWGAWKSRGEWSFNSTLKRMSTGWRSASTGESLVVTKGAVERILPLCSNISEHGHAEIMLATSRAAKGGLRVLALALRRDLSLDTGRLEDMKRDEAETNLQFVGLVAVRDPPKPETRPAIEECAQAGITVRMLTGDHPDTAVAIAFEIGILPRMEDLPHGVVLTGSQLDSMSDAELDALVDLPLVVARSSPESKVKVVEALHRRKRVVAMTGDGVNDSPALKEADVGIAMGITGTDVTKGVADIILADDNFATIVMAVREGRRIFDSISHFIMHLLTGNVAEALVLLVALAFLTDSEGLPVFILSPIAILCLNTLTGTGPAVGLAMDAAAPDIMLRPPMHFGMFTVEVVCDFAFYGSLMGSLVLGGFAIEFYAWNSGDPSDSFHCNDSDGVGCDKMMRARGTAFLIFNTLLLIHAYNCRHARLSALAMPILGNRVLAWSMVAGIVVIVVFLHVPWLNDDVFQHTGQDWEWGMMGAACIIFMLAAEGYKATKRALLTSRPVLQGHFSREPSKTALSSLPAHTVVHVDASHEGSKAVDDDYMHRKIRVSLV